VREAIILFTHNLSLHHEAKRDQHGLRYLVACLWLTTQSSWDCDVAMPDSVVSALHRCHPNVQVHVSLKHLDQAIVSSALLHRLSVSIPCSDVTNPGSLAPFEHLRRILLCSSNLRILAVDAHLDANLSKAADETAHTISNDTFQKMQIPLRQMDRLHPLEELAFDARTYDFDREHCQRLMQCMDWSRLKKLTLGPSNPTSFFDVFTDSLPTLEELDIAYHSWPRALYPSPQQDLLKNCSEFISSLGSLKKITIHCDIVDARLPFWRRLVDTHGERLESFSLQSRHELCEEPIWQSPISDYLVHFTALRNLDLTILYTAPLYTWPRSCLSCAYCPATRHLIVSNLS
jgi:hypothetical protein